MHAWHTARGKEKDRIQRAGRRQRRKARPKMRCRIDTSITMGRQKRGAHQRGRISPLRKHESDSILTVLRCWCRCALSRLALISRRDVSSPPPTPFFRELPLLLPSDNAPLVCAAIPGPDNPIERRDYFALLAINLDWPRSFSPERIYNTRLFCNG